MKKLFKEAFHDAMVLSAFIILPMAFLGPGWSPKKDPPPGLREATFTELHSEKSQDERARPAG